MSYDGLRRLTETGIDGWDITQATYMTDYLIMGVGILTGMLMWRQFGRSGDWPDALPQTFSAWGLLSGISFGFAGVALHMLATAVQDGATISKVWFTDGSLWLYPWLMTVLLWPLATSSLFGMAAAYGQMNMSWIRAAKVIGVILSIVEVCLCIFDLDHSGVPSTIWGTVAAVACVPIALALGRDNPGYPLCVVGYVIHLLGYILFFSLAAICAPHPPQEVIETESGPLTLRHPEAVEEQPLNFCTESFSRIAAFHVCYALSLAVLYLGVRLKADRDRDVSYMNLMRNAYKPKNPRCCGV